ncbi:MAG: HAD family phosphatase [Nocardiopsaceae bacterium]|jgi:putative hydrolase of the HAD superfamily|nr:HAD family phosphatase [Nocardiopsaceae bacterium]
MPIHNAAGSGASSAEIRAVIFDIGGVLEHVADPDVELGTKWRDRLGLSQAAFIAAMGKVDPENRSQTGEMTEAEYRERCAAELGLSPAQADEFMADMWDWYCGELDEDLMAFAASLRPDLRTAIISNSADGARREEVGRYAFDTSFDPIIYSHEVGLAKPDRAIFELTCERMGLAPDETIFVDDVPGHVAAAGTVGMHAIVHVSTPETIAAVNALRGE